MATITKTQLVSSIRVAVNADGASKHKWKTAGELARQWYEGSYDSWMGEKEALLKLIITPALPKTVQTALLRDLPRKGTEKAELYIGGEELLAEHQAEKIRAKAYQHSMFKYVTKAAFEAELEAKKPKGTKGKGKGKKENDNDNDNDNDEIDSGKFATNKAKLMADCSNWVKRLQKSEGEDFDINAAIAALNAVIAVLTK